MCKICWLKIPNCLGKTSENWKEKYIILSLRSGVLVLFASCSRMFYVHLTDAIRRRLDVRNNLTLIGCFYWCWFRFLKDTVWNKVALIAIGVGDEGGRGARPPTKYSGKIFLWQLLCKIRAFFGQKSCENRKLTFHKNSGILIIRKLLRSRAM